MASIVAFSPVRQHPEVLALFLKHMARQPVDLWLYDDNTDPDSSALVKHSGARVLPTIPQLHPSAYRRAEDTHKWDVPTYQRVAAIKNAAIDRFYRTTDATHLFLIDSDVLVQPGLVAHLAEAKAPIIASVYWTRWFPELAPQPNMWGSSPERLVTPGHHEVAGTGACTLIQRQVLRRVRFDPQPQMPKEGEGRWFCYLARQAGYRLMMCSHLNPFHVYRDSEIPAAAEWSHKELADAVGHEGRIAASPG